MVKSRDLWPHAYCFEQDAFMLFEDPETSEVLINIFINMIFHPEPRPIEMKLTKTYNISNEFLQTASEMFTYLHLCPKFTYKWNNLYIDLLLNATPDIIVLTLNKLMVIGRRNGDKNVVDTAKTVLMDIATTLSLNFQTMNPLAKNTSKEIINISSQGIN